MEIIDQKLYFALKTEVRTTPGRFPRKVVDLDEHYVIKSGPKFTPPSIKSILRHCAEIQRRLKEFGSIVYVTNDRADEYALRKRTHSCLFMGAYAVLYLNWSTSYTMEKMSCISNEALSCFCDHNGSTKYRLSVSDCLDGINIAVRKNGWFTLDGVDPLKNGLNMNWVIPNKVIAMKDPKANQDDGKMAVDKRYMKELLKHRIDYLVRLNSKDYENDEKYGEAYLPDDIFAHGIGLYDFPIKDGGVPTQKQVNSFLEICSIAETQIAVHCHAGFGRTGTMIACYLIRDYSFTSRQAVAWLNMCRRGSVMGQQHDFLDRFYKEVQGEKPRHPVCVNVKDPEFVCCQSQAHSEEDENCREISKDLNLDEPQIKKWRLDKL